jgi:hypothetical protein
MGGKSFAYCDNLSDIYFNGTEAEWNKVDSKGSEIPSTATVHFAS